jgi:hypothetical protein
MSRIRVSFDGEVGIDSGGLSKEAFLLISKHIAFYVGPKCRKLMTFSKSSEESSSGSKNCGYFFNSFFNSEFIIEHLELDKMAINQFTPSMECISMLENDPIFSVENFIRFIGTFISKCLFDKHLIDFPLSSPLLQHILGGLFLGFSNEESKDEM